MRTFCKKVWRIWWFNHCLEDNMREYIQRMLAMAFCKHKILRQNQHIITYNINCYIIYCVVYIKPNTIYTIILYTSWTLSFNEIRSQKQIRGNKYKLKRKAEQPNSCLRTALPLSTYVYIYNVYVYIICITYFTYSCTLFCLSLLHLAYWGPVNMWPPIAKIMARHGPVVALFVVRKKLQTQKKKAESDPMHWFSRISQHIEKKWSRIALIKVLCESKLMYGRAK